MFKKNNVQGTGADGMLNDVEQNSTTITTTASTMFNQNNSSKANSEYLKSNVLGWELTRCSSSL